MLGTDRRGRGVLRTTCAGVALVLLAAACAPRAESPEGLRVADLPETTIAAPETRRW